MTLLPEQKLTLTRLIVLSNELFELIQDGEGRMEDDQQDEVYAALGFVNNQIQTIGALYRAKDLSGVPDGMIADLLGGSARMAGLAQTVLDSVRASLDFDGESLPERPFR